MGDLISRAAAIEAISSVEESYEREEDMDCAEAVMSARWAVRELNPVDAVPVVHGEWVEEPDRVNHYHCSNCGVVWGIAARAMKYCPNCAAKIMNSPMWEVEGAT